MSDMRVKHGLSHNHPLYDRWVGMRQRCNDPSHVRYAEYGGKGITVCRRWDSFQAFVDDMGECPEGMTLERIDNSKGYSIANCRWATYAEQAKNRSMTVWIELDGERMCLADWAKRIGICDGSLRNRLDKWDLRRALTTSKIVNKRKDND